MECAMPILPRLFKACSIVLLPASATFAQTQATGQSAEPWHGDPGITETIAQIMAREAATPPTPPEPKPRHIKPRSPDVQAPDSLGEVPRWPWDGNWNTGPAATPTYPALNPGNGPFAPRDPQTASTSFLGESLSDATGIFPPDTGGGVGPTQVLAVTNGKVKVYDRTGVLGGLNVTLNTFFASVRGSSGTSDPHCVFDKLSGRWYLAAVNVASTNNRILLAVSSGSALTSTSSFTFFQFSQNTVAPAGDTGWFADYPTLGVDANALYVSGDMFNGNNYAGSTGWVIRKSDLLAGTLTAFAFRNSAGGMGAATSGITSARGVSNDDPASTQGYFIGTDAGTKGRLVLVRVNTPGGTPTLTAVNISVPATAAPLDAPTNGGTLNIDTVDDRLMLARMYLNRATNVRSLWTAHTIRVTSVGAGSSAGDRNGTRWYQLTNLSGTPAVTQSGTLFDNAASNPVFYSDGTIAATGQGHAAIGTTTSSTSEFLQVSVAGRLVTDSLGSIQARTVAQTSTTSYNAGSQNGSYRWGDFSVTTVDPVDDQSIWTFQEYCNATNSYGVRVIKLLAPPPATPVSCTPSTVAAGASGVSVVVAGMAVSGSAFYDTDPAGPAYQTHLQAAFSGTGITVTSVAFTPSDPTHVTLTVNVAGGATATARDVTITNPDGQVRTGTGVLTISSNGCTAPSISGQPSGQTICEGGSVSFGVTAGGTGLSYQWRKGGTNIGGATAAMYTINPAAPGDSGSYDCVVTGTCGNATSNPAVLTVNATTAVTGQPMAQTVCAGDSASFSVAGNGAALMYQWRKGGTNIGGATSSTYMIGSAAAGDVGSYDCVVTGTCGMATSDAAMLNLAANPMVTHNPMPQTVCTGGMATFSITASNAVSYQWFRNGTMVSGATFSSLTINPATMANAGNYYCVATGACSGATASSNFALLQVFDPVVINTQPMPQSACAGASVGLSVDAGGSIETYQWRKNTVNIDGATDTMYTIASAQVTDTGSYDCVITGDCNTMTTNAVNVSIGGPPQINGQPTDQTACAGGSASFTVSAMGTGLSYQWRKNTVNVGGATSAMLTINPVSAGDIGSYDCVVTGGCGSMTSSAAMLSVNDATSITGQPMAQTACVGASASFSVTATGASLTYQWRRNTVNIGGANAATLTINPVAAASAGSYDCVITGTCGVVTSNAVSLSVCAVDFDCSGTVTVQDIFAYLNAWFGGDPRADFDGNPGLSVQDIFAFLNAWFAGC
jgi:hypothetical protein